jgi:hypothetical protein
VDQTWIGFEFFRQENSHVMGRVPDVSRPLGLILGKILFLLLVYLPDVLQQTGNSAKIAKVW